MKLIKRILLLPIAIMIAMISGVFHALIWCFDDTYNHEAAKHATCLWAEDLLH